ncbi:MAG TPA: glycosyl transferase family 1 [Rhodocyclaceae bacterium]|nr:MAG: glycosyl transferase family 1 [Betaproteobacteria bacterium CG2_30_68_42]PIV72017.1 MAG: glycosyl transferase family 1 [Rhodocyclales bacterium CG17_big_fil_post_rev_8_21_14_2_50_68_7]PIX75479.1 MAG: glycosyl transferase family 1 [Rhodocyclales bacterium CG_4_10_14_3_um_filter_68_10]PJA58081.1 MAG: glycosyl transferase family 1 [Rhodocyclales bacterium CG_4_9_14_3_um_filter_68_10]HCX33729.1 glycosyl transferase family 1 [Rhodocyclaceae bacterium]
MSTVLFMAEAATLAHVARPLFLAGCLDSARHRVLLACDPRTRWLTGKYPFETLPLPSQSSERFIEALAKGRPLYDTATLEGYVRDDLATIERAQPDLVVGDFRLSLSVSARLAKVPYLAIANAYWSPWARVRYRVPSLPLTRLLPIAVADALFNLARPAAFAYHCLPLERVRRRHGLPSLGFDLRRVYCDGDQVLYADLPELFPLRDAPPEHRFLGPIVWSPPLTPPAWWDSAGDEKPIVYVTLGSSGVADLLPGLLAALASLPVTVLVATAGHGLAGPVPANALVADYLPGEEAARRSRLVICNGGSPTSQQALAAGVPVIGIATNLDQFLNMAAIEAAGAGLTLRADRFAAARLREAAMALLRSPRATESARRLRGACEAHDARRNFREIMNNLPTRHTKGGPS